MRRTSRSEMAGTGNPMPAPQTLLAEADFIRGVVTVKLVCDEKLPEGMFITLYAKPEAWKDVPEAKRPLTRRVQAKGNTFRIEGLPDGVYRLPRRTAIRAPTVRSTAAARCV